MSKRSQLTPKREAKSEACHSDSASLNFSSDSVLSDDAGVLLIDCEKGYSAFATTSERSEVNIGSSEKRRL